MEVDSSKRTQISRKKVLMSIYRDRLLYLMVVPALIWFIVFCYGPMGGLVIAFQEYRLGMGMFGNGNWVGLKNFQKIFDDDYFWRAFTNTIIFAVYRIIVCLSGAVILSIMLSEIKSRVYKSIVQTLVYIPRFFSWIIVAAFAIALLNPDQGMNLILKQAGLPTLTLTNASQFRGVVVFTDLWKDVGFNSVIFMATIVQIDTALYESASIDGATRMKKIRYITMPALKTTILVVMVLWIGSIINVGFDQIFNLYNPVVYDVGDILDTYIYRLAFQGSANKFSVAAAAGLFKSVVSVILLVSAELTAKSMGESAIFE